MAKNTAKDDWNEATSRTGWSRWSIAATTYPREASASHKRLIAVPQAP
jgi:hypothetical protein